MIDLSGLQAIANGFMTADVTITPYAGVGADRTGDDVEQFDTPVTGIKGWIVNEATKTFSSGGAMEAVVDQTTLRVPIGTAIKSKDQVTVGTSTWTVVDTSNDETWPVMLKAQLAEIE